MNRHDCQTRHAILRAALHQFAECGYAGASVQAIVNAAQVTKPALYYYFPSKAKLYQAIVDFAHDERYRLMQEAVAKGGTTAARLGEIVTALFEFSQANADLMRLAFASLFAAPGELPAEGQSHAKGRRNYEYVRTLIRQGQAAGELDNRFDSEELAFGIYGQMNTYVMVRLVWPQRRLDRRMARRVVDLFLRGATNGHVPPPTRQRTKRP